MQTKYIYKYHLNDTLLWMAFASPNRDHKFPCIGAFVSENWSTDIVSLFLNKTMITCSYT